MGTFPAGRRTPNGRQITFYKVSVRNSKSTSLYTSDVFRIPAGGGTAANLTKDIDGFAWPAFWR